MRICLDETNSFNYFNGLEQRLEAKSIATYNVMDRDYVKGFYREGNVTLSSIFKAKGNEAAMVFVIGCDVFEDKKDSRIMRNKREFDTLKCKKVPQSLEIGLFFCQIFIFII